MWKGFSKVYIYYANSISHVNLVSVWIVRSCVRLCAGVCSVFFFILAKTKSHQHVSLSCVLSLKNILLCHLIPQPISASPSALVSACDSLKLKRKYFGSLNCFSCLDNQVCFGRQRIFWNGKHSLLVGCFFPDTHTLTFSVNRRVFPVGRLPIHTCTHTNT